MDSLLIDDFLVRALVAGLGVALVAGPLGVFVVWRRMAYFGDTLAHSALLGIALGFVLHLNIHVGIIVTCMLLALALLALQRRQDLATDTLLGILSHSALALGIVVVSFLDRVRVDLFAYLFGDLLAVTDVDLYWIYAGGLTALVILTFIWRHLLAITVHEEVARIEGVPVTLVRIIFMLLIALVIAVALKIVGILLITSLLIIPAATARRFARSPEQMAILASAAGCIAVSAGLGGSLQWDTPSGPSVVVAALAMFLLTTFWPSSRGNT